MKKINVLILISVTMLFGCKKDFLEMKQPGVDETSDEYFSDPEHAFEMCISAYDMLDGGDFQGHEWIPNDHYEWVVGSIFSDDALKGGESAGDQQDFLDGANFNLTPDNGISFNMWEQLYKAIYRATYAISKLEIMEGIDESLRKEYIAEMRFVRAFSYFRLVRFFGDIPYMPTIENYGNLPGESPKSEVYAFIEEDLALAISDLPSSRFGTDEQGRAIKGAAQGYLAMTYLYQKKWSECKSQCEEIMSGGIHGLVGDPLNIFTAEQQWGSEVVWATNYDDLVGSNSGYTEGSYLTVWYAPRDNQQGHQGWGFHLPTQDLIDAFESGDARRDAWIVDDGEVLPGNTIAHDFDGTKYQETGYMCQKYRVPASQFNLAVPNGQAIDQIHMRYADVLLMHAEASMELGSEGDAKSSLALVRQRAGLSDYPDASTIANYKETTLLGLEELRAVVYHERRIELALENSRFFDLVRWGVAQTVMHNFGVTSYVDGCSGLLPIPSVDIQRAEGLLTQNPCY